MAFHLYPFMLEYDPHTGDHGLGYFGHAMNVGAYVVHHPKLGWLCYLCAHTSTRGLGGAALDADALDADALDAGGQGGSSYSIEPHDSFGRRAFLADLGLWMELTTGQMIKRIDVDAALRTLIVTLVAPPQGEWLSSRARIRLSTPALPTGRRTADGFAVVGGQRVRGAWEVSVPLVRVKSVEVKVTWATA